MHGRQRSLRLLGLTTLVLGIASCAFDGSSLENLTTSDPTTDTGQRDTELDTRVRDTSPDTRVRDTNPDSDTGECNEGLTRCGTLCVDLDMARDNCGACGTRCGGEQACNDGLCGCAERYTACGEHCVNLQSDDTHCGECGTTCDADRECIGGICACRGALGLTNCDGECVNTSNDLRYCGSCDVSCEAGLVCAGSACDDICGDGLDFCDPSCVDTQTDPAHCGECGTLCRDDQVCTDGACECAPGLTGCGPLCIDTDNDLGHCGGCDITCGPDSVCETGACVCAEDYTSCDSGDGPTCVATASDDAHCGGCNIACPAGEFCQDGACACGAGDVRCASTGTCIDTSTNLAHCGACDNACERFETCEDSACTGGCLAPNAICGEACVAINTDADHCGGCDNACLRGGSCVAGACRCPAPDLLEPNDAVGTSLPLGAITPEFDGLLTGLNLCGGDIDRFTIHAAGLEPTITLSSRGDCADGTLDLTLSLENDAGVVLETASSSSAFPCPELDAITLGFDTQYHLVVTANGGTGGHYGLTLDARRFVEWEGNDAIEFADGPFSRSALVRGRHGTEETGGAGDIDLWGIKLAHHTTASFLTSANGLSGCNGDTIITILDEVGVAITSDDDSGFADRCSYLSNVLLEPGVYYVSVSTDRADADSFGYYLEIDLPLTEEVEPNNDAASANGPETVPFSVEGGVTQADDVDVFKFRLSSATDVVVSTTGPLATCAFATQLRVSHIDGTEMGVANGAPDPSSDVCAALPLSLGAGFYTVEVTGMDDIGPYVLNVVTSD